MFQLQSEPYRAADGETRRSAGLKRRRFEDSVEEQSYTPRSRKPRLNELRVQHTAADRDLAAIRFEADHVRSAPTSLQRQHGTSTSDHFREFGFSHIPESAGAGLSGGLESGKIELQKNQNTVFFPSSSNLQVVDSNFNAFRDQIVSNVFINVDRPKHNENVFVRVPTGNGSEVRPEVSNIEITSLKQPLQIRKSSEIYYRHLLTLGRGSPLWIPEPSTSLPIEYQKAGIGIGDVGILKESGGFDFLFNVYQPCNDANHPINPRAMPDGFVPLCPPEERDVNSHAEFKNHSSLASSHVNSRHDESSGLIFESSAEDGAILTMPKGANSIDLDNMGMVRKYISKNVHKWYMYANEVRGRNTGNGDLRLVIGKTSATTWGMAAFARVSDEDTPSCLKFKPTRSGTGDGDSGHDASSSKYRWEYSGNMKAEVKSGPDDHEIEKLRSFDRLRGGDGQMAYENQCLFVRTINVTLQERRQYPRDLRLQQANYGPDNFSSLGVGTPKFAEYDGHEWQPDQLSRNPIAPVHVQHRDSRNVDEDNELCALPPISRLFEIGENASNYRGGRYDFNVGTGARGRVARNSSSPVLARARRIPRRLIHQPPISRYDSTIRRQTGPSNTFPTTTSSQPGMGPQNAYPTNPSQYPLPEYHHMGPRYMSFNPRPRLSIEPRQQQSQSANPHSASSGRLQSQFSIPPSASIGKHRHKINFKALSKHHDEDVELILDDVPKPAERACDSCRSREIRCYAFAESDPPVCQQCRRYGFQCTFFLPVQETRLEKKLGEEKMENAVDAASRTNSKPGPSPSQLLTASIGWKPPAADADYSSYAELPLDSTGLSLDTMNGVSEVGDHVRRGVEDDEQSPIDQYSQHQHAEIDVKANNSSISTHFTNNFPHVPSPPPAGSGVRRHLSLTYGEAVGGPRTMLKRSGTLQATLPVHLQHSTGSIDPSSSSPPPVLPTLGPFQKVKRNQIRRQDGPALPEYKDGAGDNRKVKNSELDFALPVTLELDPPPDSSPPLPSHLHPSKIINEYLLKCVPRATMAITEDGDWISVLQESDIAFPADDVLLSRIQDMYSVGFEEGVVFLRNRRNQALGL